MDFPQPLFESHLHQRKICLACGQRFADSVLRTTTHEVLPICVDCSKRWNFYGYQVLRRIKPGPLFFRLLRFKLMRPFQPPSWLTIWADLKALRDWAGKMKRWT